jgi:hypothetical protein
MRAVFNHTLDVLLSERCTLHNGCWLSAAHYTICRVWRLLSTRGRPLQAQALDTI